MRGLRKYFKMIITAVICFAMSLIPGKKKNSDAVRIPAGGQAVSNNTTGKVSVRNVFTERQEKALPNLERSLQGLQSSSPGYNSKKVFFWLQGPGDNRLMPVNNNGNSPLAFKSSG